MKNTNNVNNFNIVNNNENKGEINMTTIGTKLAAALDAVGGKDAFIAKVVEEKKAAADAVIAAEIAETIAAAVATALDKKFAKVVNLDTGEVKFVAKQRKLSWLDRLVRQSDRAAAERRCNAVWQAAIKKAAHKTVKISTDATLRAYRYSLDAELREERKGESRRQYLWETYACVEVSVGGVSELVLKAANKIAPSTTQQLASLKFTKLLSKCKKHTVTVSTVVAASLNSDYSSGFRGDDYSSWTLFGINANTLLLQCHGAQYGGLLAVDGVAQPDNTADKVRRVLKASGVKRENVKEIKVACCFGGYNRDICIDGVRVTFVAKGLYETIFMHEMFSNDIKCYEVNAETAAWLKSAGNAGLVLDAYTDLLGDGRAEADYVKNVYCKFLRELSKVKTIDDVLAILPGFNRLPAFKVADQLRDIVDNISKVGSYGVDKKQLRNALRDVKIDAEAHDTAALALLVEDGNKAAATAQAILDAEDICTLSEVVPQFTLLTSKGIVKKAHEIAHDLDTKTGGVVNSQKLLNHIGQLVADKEVRDYNLAVIAETEGITLPDPIMVLLEKHGDTEAVFDHDPLSLLKEEWFDDVVWTLRNMFRQYHRVTRYTQDTADIEAKLGKMLATVDVDAWNERARQLRDAEFQDDFLAAFDEGGELPEEATVDEAYVKVVKNKSVAERILKESVLTRKQKGVAITQLYLCYNNKEHTAVTMNVMPHVLDYGTMVSRIDNTIEATKMVISRAGHMKWCERYTRAVVQIVLQDYNMLSTLFMPDSGYRVLYRAISGDGRDTFWICKETASGKVMVNLISGLVVSEATWRQKTSGNGYYFYDLKWDNPSPGDLKGHALLMCGTYVGPHKDRYSVNWKEVINYCTSGAQDAWANGYGYDAETGPTYVQMCEFNARMTLHKAFNTQLEHTPIRSFAILCGKIKKHGTWGNTYMAEKPADGIFFGLASRLAEAFSFEASDDDGDIVEFTEEAILGKAFMSRPWYMTKGLMHAVSAKTMLHLLKTWAYAGDPIFVDLTNMTEQQKDLWLRMGMKKWTNARWVDDNGDLFDCTDRLFVCFYDDEEQTAAEKVAAAKAAWQRVKDGTATDDDLAVLVVDLFADANAAKVGAKVWQYQTGYNALNQDVKPHHEAVLSTQLFNTMARFNLAKAKKIAQVLFSMQLVKAVENFENYDGKAVSYRDIRQEVEVSFDDETGDEVENVLPMNVDRLLDNIAPVIKQWDKGTYKKGADQLLEKLCKMAGKLNLPVKGTHTFIVPDPAAMLIGVSVLHVTNVIRDESGRQVGGGITEFFSNTEDAGNVTAEQYVERLQKAVAENNALYEAQKAANKKLTVRYISDDEVAVVAEFVNNMGDGLTAVPADETTARLNEGWDFDGDTIYVYKMDMGYSLICDVSGRQMYVWDPTSEKKVTLMFANRYPKNHSDGFAVIDKSCPYKHTLCVWMCDSEADIPDDAPKSTVVF